jgi:hypothetical protein
VCKISILSLKSIGSRLEVFMSGRQLMLPSAARGRNQISDIGDGRARSALSFQRSASEQTQ